MGIHVHLFKSSKLELQRAEYEILDLYLRPLRTKIEAFESGESNRVIPWKTSNFLHGKQENRKTFRLKIP